LGHNSRAWTGSYDEVTLPISNHLTPLIPLSKMERGKKIKRRGLDAPFFQTTSPSPEFRGRG
jgi:hypothetical protein